MTDLLASRRRRGEAMFRGGSFDRSGAGPELHEEWKKRCEVEISNTDQIRAVSGIRTHQPSILEPNLVGPSGVGKAHERNKERTANTTNLNVSALPESSLTSWTFARAVLNSLPTTDSTTGSLSRTVMIRSSCNGTVSGCKY